MTLDPQKLRTAIERGVGSGSELEGIGELIPPSAVGPAGVANLGSGGFGPRAGTGGYFSDVCAAGSESLPPWAWNDPLPSWFSIDGGIGAHGVLTEPGLYLFYVFANAPQAATDGTLRLNLSTPLTNLVSTYRDIRFGGLGMVDVLSVREADLPFSPATPFAFGEGDLTVEMMLMFRMQKLLAVG